MKALLDLYFFEEHCKTKAKRNSCRMTWRLSVITKIMLEFELRSSVNFASLVRLVL